jgi:hypothetical protein
MNLTTNGGLLRHGDELLKFADVDNLIVKEV